ncbi:DNA glycosylase [Sparassis latifolia]
MGAVQERPHGTSMHRIAQPEPLQESLLEWYAGVHTSRGMPWRKPYDPTLGPDEQAQRAYEVWISEIMLQQTQVATVIPYYNRWMGKFPTIRDLAESDIEMVNGIWKGLGYYSRAARLLSGAKKAVEQFHGRLPDNAKDMQSQIPGIGRYSAGAICSIAYNQCVPVLDGNVHRLLSRVLALHAPPKAKQTLDVLWAGATALVEGSTRPGDLNQALIELGSTVCKVRDPHCSACPLRAWCRAYQYQTSKEKPDRMAPRRDEGVPDIEELCSHCEALPAPGLVTAFPMKTGKKKAREELDIVSVIEWRSRTDDQRWFLLVRRPEGGLLAGLHEFPTSPNVPVPTSPSAMIEIASTILSDLLAAPPKSRPPPKGKTDRAPCRHVPAAGPSEDASRRYSPADESDGQHPATDGSIALRIANITPVGDVLHIFSHIRKTYRVQWVLLEGEAKEPPSLRSRPSADADRPPSLKKGKRKSSPANRCRTTTLRMADDGAKVARASASTPPQALWTPIEQVPNANVGTGVLKVWKQVSTLWENA